jgi:ABC-type uncharacterized transport system involved in gliding motility auxiliary subunit
MSARLHTRRAWTLNAWATALLLLAIAVLANRLAKEHLRLRADLSEERLFTPPPVAHELLGSLEDALEVKAFFTGHVKHGPVQLAKSMLLDQLGEFEDASRGRMQVVFADPNASSEVRAEAERYGIQPMPLRAVQGTSELTQEVFLGLLLRYRGREAVLPFVLPQSFAYGFLSELAGLERDLDLAVGFVGGGGAAEPGQAGDDFAEARGLLAKRYRVRVLDDLADGAAVPDDVRLVVVARPIDLHPRAAFALDQFVQRGGRLLILAERVRVDLSALEARLVSTGLEGLLDAWGAPLDQRLVFDQEANWLSIKDVGRTQYPFWINVGEAGMQRGVPVTGRLSGADLFWAHAVGERAVEGVERTALVRSSEQSWLVAPDEALHTGGTDLNARGLELRATEPGRPRDLMVALGGRFPTAFPDGAPAPRDALAETLWRSRVEEALRAGKEPPARQLERTGEQVLSAGEGGAVVVAGDADWAAGGKFFTPRNQLLFENLADWLMLEDELVALRATLPRDRRITDFLAREKQRRGLPVLEGTGALALEGLDPALVAEAERAAERRRGLAMLCATGGALALATGLALASRAWLSGGAR